MEGTVFELHVPGLLLLLLLTRDHRVLTSMSVIRLDIFKGMLGQFTALSVAPKNVCFWQELFPHPNQAVLVPKTLKAVKAVLS